MLLALACCGLGCRAAPRHVDWTPSAATGDVAVEVQRELARARADGRRLLVYVGATWCEPCRRFHEAATAGKLDAQFGTLRLVEFDLDRDRDRLSAAGYQSSYIPLFAAPLDDGRASGRQIQGSVKGDGAVDEIAPRLHALLRDSLPPS
jgi:thiol-disulfide isomerase/thioredoxin